MMLISIKICCLILIILVNFLIESDCQLNTRIRRRLLSTPNDTTTTESYVIELSSSPTTSSSSSISYVQLLRQASDLSSVTLPTDDVTLVETTISPLVRSLPESPTDTDDIGPDEEEEVEEEPTFKIPQDAVEFMDYFDDLIKTVRRNLEDILEKYLPQLFEMSSSVVLSPDCTYDVVRVLLALREMKPWAIKCKYTSIHVMSRLTIIIIIILPTCIQLNQLNFD